MFSAQLDSALHPSLPYALSDLSDTTGDGRPDPTNPPLLEGISHSSPAPRRRFIHSLRTGGRRIGISHTFLLQAVRRPQSCLRPRAGGTGRPCRQSPAAVTAAAGPSRAPGLKQKPGSPGSAGQRWEQGWAGRTHSSGWGPSCLLPGAPSPLSASAPSTAASLRVQVPSAHKNTSHWPGAALTASTRSQLQASIST